MKTCFMCGISSDKSLLYEVIHGNEIVDACKNCLLKENLLIVKNPQVLQQEKQQVKYSSFRETIKEFEKQKKPSSAIVPFREEATLREIVERNYQEKNLAAPKKREDLVDNFHWVIMRARRLKKLTKEQLAKEISESVGAIDLAEKGILPEGNYRLAEKLENFLGITIIKKEQYEKLFPKSFEANENKERKPEDFDISSLKEMTISDIRELAKKDFIKEKESNKEAKKDNELSEEEIHDIVFGKKRN